MAVHAKKTGTFRLFFFVSVVSGAALLYGCCGGGNRIDNPGSDNRYHGEYASPAFKSVPLTRTDSAHVATTAPFADQRFAAFLFDMDGTVLTSTASVERVWGAWAAQHGLDVPTFLATMQGRRAIDIVRALAPPGVDPVAEAARITQSEIDDVEGIKPITGASRFLASLGSKRWAIVTSSPRALALRRLQAAGLPMPPYLIAAEDIARGKPAPDGYLLAARRLGVDPRQCLVFEDAAVGIAAGHAAGARVLTVTATHAPAASGHASSDTESGGDNHTKTATKAPVPVSVVDYQRISVSLDEAGLLQLVSRD